jgi:hypothetical protein
MYHYFGDGTQKFRRRADLLAIPMPHAYIDAILIGFAGRTK